MIQSLGRRCHAAAAAQRHTAYPSAKNTLRLRRNCFFGCGARCAAATHASALPVTLRALRDGQRSSGAPPRGIAAAASATNVPPARLLTLRFRLHVLLAPLCAYPTRFSVTLRALRDGQLLTAPPNMPLACGQPVFRSAQFAVALLPGAPRFFFILPAFSPSGQPWQRPCA